MKFNFMSETEEREIPREVYELTFFKVKKAFPKSPTAQVMENILLVVGSNFNFYSFI